MEEPADDDASEVRRVHLDEGVDRRQVILSTLGPERERSRLTRASGHHLGTTNILKINHLARRSARPWALIGRHC
jgi:hypothetical protein